jgi:hypothetical protein
VSRIRWLILILGPWPIVGSSWAVSAWFKSEPYAVAARNDVMPSPSGEPRFSSGERSRHAARLNDETLEWACAQSAARLENELGAECRVVVRSPFVLGGDLDSGELERWHERTIAPAVRAMQHCYFEAQPNVPVTVLLFRNEQSYNRYCEKLFGDRDISSYGYYKPNLRVLLMNIATGDGTLLHELTHALMDFDFPGVPDWFNEGLASLHEQCRFRAGSGGPWIEGLVNWRLKGLQEVIRQRQLRSLTSLVEDNDFHGPLEGTNYAQARYFCLYMQQQGLLEDFFRVFRKQHVHDPRGLASLAEVFRQTTWQRLDADFQRWVLELAE